jgi:uncharacterized protein (TIGR03435 family)
VLLVVSLSVGVAAQPTPQAFEVASVKPNTSGNFIRAIGPGPGGRFQVLNNTLRELVAYAYAVDMSRARLQIVGGPAWLDRDAFDIDAIAPGNVITPASAREMLKTLLADRFKLKVRYERREVATYDLVLDRADRRLGSRLRASSIDCEARRAAARRGGTPPTIPTGPPPDPATIRPVCGLRQNTGLLAGDAVSMVQLASALAPRAGRIVSDRTGLTGYFDLDLNWTPGQEALPRPGGAPEPVVDTGAPPLFTAIREQLGLRLEGARADVEVVVIDSAEPPTPN